MAALVQNKPYINKVVGICSMHIIITDKIIMKVQYPASLEMWPKEISKRRQYIRHFPLFFSFTSQRQNVAKITETMSTTLDAMLRIKKSWDFAQNNTLCARSTTYESHSPLYVQPQLSLGIKYCRPYMMAPVKTHVTPTTAINNSRK